MASMRLVLPGCNDIQIKTAIALVRSSLSDELKQERAREMAAIRKRRQRDRDRDIERDIERDISVTDGVTVTPVSPLDPPSGSSLRSDPGLLLPGSPDSSKPDPEDPHSDERPGPVTRYSSDFIAFWMAYPNRVGKQAAWAAWKRQRPSLALIQGALVWQRVSQRWKDGYIPNPATYINQHRWLDERDISVTPGVTPTGHPPARNFREEATEQAFAVAKQMRMQMKGGSQ
jgi:hypothetical protein